MIPAAIAEAEPWPARLGRALAVTGSLGGTAAGLIELTVGPQIRSWVGGKYDTTRLGIVTIALSLVALVAAVGYRRARASTPAQRLLVAGALGLPGLICFTTVGRLWYVPGTLLIVAAVLTTTTLRGDGAALSDTLAAHWLALLVALLGCLDILLGATALGFAGLLGILGGGGVIVIAATARRVDKRTHAILLYIAAIPFAALTWWSLITPLIAILIVALGTTLIVTAARAPRDATGAARA